METTMNQENKVFNEPLQENLELLRAAILHELREMQCFAALIRNEQNPQARGHLIKAYQFREKVSNYRRALDQLQALQKIPVE
jgi:hypothetical protein